MKDIFWIIVYAVWMIGMSSCDVPYTRNLSVPNVEGVHKSRVSLVAALEKAGYTCEHDGFDATCWLPGEHLLTLNFWDGFDNIRVRISKPKIEQIVAEVIAEIETEATEEQVSEIVEEVAEVVETVSEEPPEEPSEEPSEELTPEELAEMIVREIETVTETEIKTPIEEVTEIVEDVITEIAPVEETETEITPEPDSEIRTPQPPQQPPQQPPPDVEMHNHRHSHAEITHSHDDYGQHTHARLQHQHDHVKNHENLPPPGNYLGHAQDHNHEDGDDHLSSRWRPYVERHESSGEVAYWVYVICGDESDAWVKDLYVTNREKSSPKIIASRVLKSDVSTPSDDWVDYIEIETDSRDMLMREMQDLYNANFYGDWRFELQAQIVVEEHVHENCKLIGWDTDNDGVVNHAHSGASHFHRKQE